LVSCSSDASASNQSASLPTVNELTQNFEKINNEGGRGNYFTYFLSNDYLIQAAANKGDSFVRCEASHNLKSNELTNTQKIALEKLGWLKPDIGEVNYWIMQPLTSKEETKELSELFIKTITEVYHSSTVDSLVVSLEK
jgi:hypothetical protein